MKNKKYLQPEIGIELLRINDILTASDDTSDIDTSDKPNNTNYENGWYILSEH